MNQDVLTKIISNDGPIDQQFFLLSKHFGVHSCGSLDQTHEVEGEKNIKSLNCLCWLTAALPS